MKHGVRRGEKEGRRGGGRRREKEVIVNKEGKVEENK